MTQKTFTFTNERISSENLDNGRQVVKVTPGGTNILAYIVNGKITRYEAEDSTGNSRALFSISQSIPDGGHLVDTGFPFSSAAGDCWICSDDADFGILCYQVWCPDIPPPPEKLPL
jgi:hypothetical protein